MMEAPTLSRFLLRSRMLWLIVFSLMFLSWAWWDSERYITCIYFSPVWGTEGFFHSYDGGFSMGWDSENPFAVSGFHMSRESMWYHLTSVAITIWSRDTPEFSYSSNMIIVSGICALYLRWR